MLPLLHESEETQTYLIKSFDVPPVLQNLEFYLLTDGLLDKFLLGHILRSVPTAQQLPAACLHWYMYSEWKKK